MTGINSEAYIAPYRDQALSLSLSLTPNTYWQRYIALGSSILNTVCLETGASPRCLSKAPPDMTTTDRHWLAHVTAMPGPHQVLQHLPHPNTQPTQLPCLHTTYTGMFSGKGEPSTASRSTLGSLLP